MDQHTTGAVYPISQSQRNIWSLELIYGGTSINIICTTVRIRGRLDVTLLNRTLNRVIEEDAVLRTRITLVNGEPQQYTVAYSEGQFSFYDFSATDEQGFSGWESSAARLSMAVCDSRLYDFSMFKLDEGSGGVLLRLHHLIADGYSLVRLANRISEIYLALLDGKTVERQTVPDYREHVAAEANYLASPAYSADEKFWERSLGEFAGCRTSLKNNITANVSPVGRRRSHYFSESLNHAIGDFCTRNRTAPFSVYCMALCIHMSRMSGTSKLCLGVPILNRPDFRAKQSGGMFVSTLPFFAEVDASLSFDEYNRRLTERWYDLLRHQRYPFTDIQKLCRASEDGITRLFDVVLSFQDGKIFNGAETSVSFSGKWNYNGCQSEQIVIHLTSFENEFRYSVDYDYLTQLYSEYDIDTLHRHVVNILSTALATPEVPLCELGLLDRGEYEKVIYTFNRRGSEVVTGTVAQSLYATALEFPHRTALISEGQRTSYSELYERARRLASALPLTSVGSVAAVIMPRSGDTVTAMLSAAFAGGAWVVIPEHWPDARIQRALADAGAEVVITTPQLMPRLGQLGLSLVDVTADYPPLSVELPETGERDLAYIVYTSGSTGTPKGAMIENRSIVNFASGMRCVFGYGAVLSICNEGFDVFVMETVVSLLCGKTVVIASEEDIKSPRRVAGLIRGYAVGTFSMTPSRLSCFLENEEFRGALKYVESVVCGGEPIYGELVQQFGACSGARLYNQYGPSETTVGVSLKLLQNSPAINAGKPMSGCRLYVLDDAMHPLPVGAVGELYIGGVCVGRGYCGNPEATEKAFLPSPFERDEIIYRTGDTACWDAEGEIIIGSRRDDQVKLRGRRIEMSEITSALLGYPGVEQAAVRLVRVGEADYLAAYYKSPEDYGELKLSAYLLSRLPDYMIPTFWTHLASMPLTPNGKIDYSALPAPVIKAGGRMPSGDAERRVLDIFVRMLSDKKLDCDCDYFRRGGDSLNAIATAAELSREFDTDFSITDLYTCRTAAAVAELITGETSGARRPDFESYEPVVRSAYPLTPIQQSLLFNALLAPEALVYNMPGAFRLPREIDIPRLRRALARLVADEELLRTSFGFDGGEGVQRVCERAELPLGELTADSFEGACREFVRPFDLKHPPLMRTAIWSDGDSRILFIDTHHIINDGEGTPILLAALERAYTEPDTPHRSQVYYKDYAAYLAQSEDDGDDGAGEYWRSAMEGIGETLLPDTDFPRGDEFDFKGEQLTSKLSPRLHDAVAKFCDRNSVTPYVLFAGTFGLLISALTGSTDFSVGTPVAGRSGGRTSGMTGAFINTLPLRVTVSPDMKVGDYFSLISQRVGGMLGHRFIPQEKIISAAGIERSLGHNTLYSTIFSMRPISEHFIFAGMPLEYLPIPTHTAKVDMTLEAYACDDGYGFTLEYASSLYERATAELRLRCFEAALASVTGGAETVGAVDMISPLDRYELLERPTMTCMPYIDETADAASARYARLYPDRLAVTGDAGDMTYLQLELRVCATAALLRRHGVGRGDTVAVCAVRSPGLVSAIFGIMRCGCAYLPVADTLPAERIAHMLGSAGVSLMLCDAASSAIAAKLPEGVTCLTDCGENDSADIYDSDPERRTTDIAQVLFTSGSTGQPKGVMISHRALSNLRATLGTIYRENGAEDGVLSSSSLLFDSFTMEVIIPVSSGMTVVMADSESCASPRRIAGLIEKFGAKAMFSTPSRARILLTDPEFRRAAGGLRLFLAGGEAMSAELVRSITDCCGGPLYNLYGPAESTVFVTAGTMKPGDRVTIGKPIANTKLYILSPDMKQVLPTSEGELYIGGESLFAGYAGQPELTEAALLPSSFIPGEKLYRTGDHVRLLADGRIEFLGRRDCQVKLNGQRIELEEITGAILRTGLVGDAETVALTQEGIGSLVAFTVPSEGYSDAALRKALTALLPAYMIPSNFIVLEAIPQTPTGKADRIALTALAENSTGLSEADAAAPISDVSAAPDGDMGDDLCSRLRRLWREALHGAAVKNDVSFFEQGGTSLAAMGLTVRYYELGESITLSEFYAHPTIDEQVELLSGDKAATEPATEPEQLSEAEPATKTTTGSEPMTATDSVIESEQKSEPVSAIAVMSEADEQSYLLTGVTGFLGAHILRGLLDRGESNIRCLTRGGKSRLFDTLSFYFGTDTAYSDMDHVQVLAGDMTEPLLGLGEAGIAALRGKIGQVIHAAADVRHFIPERESERVNTGGTANVLEAAAIIGAPTAMISTLSVAGDRLPGTPVGKPVIFDESCIDIGQNWRDNPYIRSKFLAEELVRTSGLPGSQIFRVGRLVGRGTDGVFQRNPDSNYFWRLINGICRLNCYPTGLADTPLELTPVDGCAEAIITLLGGDFTTAHVACPHEITLSEVLNALAPDAVKLSSNEFTTRLFDSYGKLPIESTAILLDARGRLDINCTPVRAVCNVTTQRLERLGFVWEKPDPAILLKNFAGRR